MRSSSATRRVALIAGAAAIVSMGSFTACSSKDKPAETKPATTLPNIAPTEKGVGVPAGEGGNNGKQGKQGGQNNPGGPNNPNKKPGTQGGQNNQGGPDGRSQGQSM